jgi:rfaE bifunctional protein kinase chain/domain
VAVVGDLIADHYLYAQPSRLSREAPVLVLTHRREEVRAGGAANVARNLWSLGADTRVLGSVGTDQNGRELIRLLEEENLTVDGVHPIAGWTTPTKTRICAAEPSRAFQQVLRVDREPEAPHSQADRERLVERVRALAGQVDALLLSDYDYGVVGEDLADAARAVQASGAVVVLDPRRGMEPFRGVTAMTPNLSELALATGRRLEDLSDPEVLIDSAHRVLDHCQPRLLLVTMGNRGMAIFGADLPKPGVTVPVSGPTDGVDPTGAGDTAAAAFTLGLASGLDGIDAMRLANASAGVVVLESGTAVCSLSKLRTALACSPRPTGLASSAAP